MVHNAAVPVFGGLYSGRGRCSAAHWNTYLFAGRRSRAERCLYYIADVGLRNYLLGFRNRDSGHVLENIVYFELLRRGYDVTIGKIDAAEVDFIAAKAGVRQYIQVTESMLSLDVRERELEPLRRIRDNYNKIILSLEPGLDTSYDGIRSLHLLDWLAEEE